MRPIVSDVSFSVASGQSVGLVGEAGSGKSLLVQAIAALLRPPLMVEGSVRFDGKNLLSMKFEERRRILGHQLAILLSGGRARLNPLERAGDQIARAILDHQPEVGREAASARAIELLERVGIADPRRMARSYPHELSGGMAQRVLVAMSLANRPRFLVADEPTAGLDVTVQRQVLEDLASLLREEGLGLLIVSRDLGIVAHYSERVIVLNEGQLTENASVRQFFISPQHPYSQRLLEATALERRQTDSRTGGVETAASDGAAEGADEGALAAPKTDETLVEVRGLVKHFPVGRDATLVAVNGVNLTIGRGETVGLVGESGSGKTTLGRLILRLTEPTAGEVWFRGQPVSHLSEGAFRALRPKLQMVFQDPGGSLNPRMTIRQALKDAMSVLKLSRAEQTQRIQEVLDAVSLPSALADSHPEGLTGSQQQRGAIARALILQPDLIVLDEAVSNLDVMGRYEIIQLLRALQKRFGISYLFISHDLMAVRRISHRVAVMYLGRIAETASTDEIFSNPVHPYTRSLLSAALAPDPEAEAPAYELSGEIPSPINLPKGCPLYTRCPVGEPECTRWEPELIPVQLMDGRGEHLVACRRSDELVAGTIVTQKEQETSSQS